MLLVKPVYGQLDAPRRWYLEAVRRLRGLGLRQHILDPCTFLVYEADHGGPTGDSSEPDVTFLGSERLCGMICLHVDDMLGAGDPTSDTYNKLLNELRKTFSFREWKDGSQLEYCGARIDRFEDGTLKLHHEEYLKKVKPLTISKHLGPEAELDQKEVTSLRGLLGAIQWPSVQSSPHLQASTSILSGSISRGLVKTALEANKLLKFAKENSDVGLNFTPLRLLELCIVTAFDASFGCRPDGTSQGGYLVMLAPRRILETEEDFYHILDWRSQKLPRVARNSLAAEAQAAACAADSTEFVCRYFEHLKQPNLSLAELLKEKSSLKPTLVTDAKALYDSYHRESLISSVTDRRISLEIRVVKEQLQSLGGNLRWVSSERQLADGLTKESTRQSLGDRLRHAKVKFLWDPDYVAAKKKPLAERSLLQREQETSRPKKGKKTHGARSVKKEKLDMIAEEENYEIEDEEVVKNDVAGGDGEAYFMRSSAVNYAVDVKELGKKLFPALLCCFPTGAQSQMDMVEVVKLQWFNWPQLVWLTLLCGVAFMVGRLLGQRRERFLEMRLAETEGRLIDADRNASMFAILVPQQDAALETARAANERLHHAYEEASDNFDRMANAFHEMADRGDGMPPVGIRTAFTELNELRTLRDDGMRLAQRVIHEMEYHMNVECPLRNAILVTEDCPTRWHSNHLCPAIHEFEEVPTLHHVRPCSHDGCAQRWTTPWIPDQESGNSLMWHLESFIEDCQYAAEMQR